MDRFREDEREDELKSPQESRASFDSRDIEKDLENCGIPDPRGASEKIHLILDMNDDSLHININFKNHPISFDLYHAYQYVEDLLDKNLIPKDLDWLQSLQNKMLTLGIFVVDAKSDQDFEKKVTESKLESQKRSIMLQRWLTEKKIPPAEWSSMNPLYQKDLLRDFEKWYREREGSK